MSSIGQKLKGLLPPPPGWEGSNLKPLLGTGDAVKLMTMAELVEVAKSGDMDGRKTFGNRFTRTQRHSNCNGAAAAAIMQKLVFIERGKFVPLSDCYTYSRINGGHDNGSMLADAMVSIQDDGVCEAVLCGPDAIFRNQYDTRKADANAKCYQALECYRIHPRDFGGDIEATQRGVWTALARGYLVQVAVQAGDNFDRVDQYGLSGVDDGYANHAVHCCGLVWHPGIREIVGTGDNTWPESWGQNGRMLLRWGHFKQTISTHEFFAVRALKPDPREKIVLK